MGPIVKYLELGFEGYFMCRIATDPDPTNEKRGLSGYTMALADEAPLDQVIRLQEDDYVRANLRDPADQVLYSQEVARIFRDRPGKAPAIGVFVTRVLFDGKPNEALEQVFLRAKVGLHGRDGVLPGPIFESRNSIVGSDDNMLFVINPFHISIRKDGDDELLLAARDELDPANPGRQLWQINDPKVYQRRLPNRVEAGSAEVLSATGVYDFFTYFADRKRYLNQVIADAEKALGACTSAEEREAHELVIQKARSRIYQIDFWGDRVSGKLGFLVGWQFDINSAKTAADQGTLHGQVARDQAWPVTIWFGGWDGDLLTGYVRGSLMVPFEPVLV